MGISQTRQNLGKNHGETGQNSGKKQRANDRRECTKAWPEEKRIVRQRKKLKELTLVRSPGGLVSELMDI
jgi:hypothetical protein